MENSIKNNLAIIIPTHNRQELLQNLLFQLSKQKTEVETIAISTIVVVDGSTDGTNEMLTTGFPDVHIVNGDGSWWYTRSINEGFKYAIHNLKPDFVLTLNDDVVLADDYLEKIVSITFLNKSDSIVGSVGITHKKPYRIVTSGNQWKNKCLGIYKQYLRYLVMVEPDKLSGIYSSVTLPGRGMLIPSSILKDLNFFDEYFKQYHSDGDFTLRAMQAGYKVKISWDAKIFVYFEKTCSSTSFLNTSYKVLIKSFFNPVSRNYLPAKSHFIWRHGYKICYPLKMLLFIVLLFRNVKCKKITN